MMKFIGYVIFVAALTFSCFSSSQASSGTYRARLRGYLSYQEREPCQGYRKAPRLDLEEERCNASRNALDARKFSKQSQEFKKDLKQSAATINEADYKIYFNHNRYNIRPSERPLLEAIARRIDAQKPKAVLIAGFADRSGSQLYNAKLAQKRSQAVFWALASLGAPPRLLQQKSYGENGFETHEQSSNELGLNRRVEIRFQE